MSADILFHSTCNKANMSGIGYVYDNTATAFKGDLSRCQFCRISATIMDACTPLRQSSEGFNAVVNSACCCARSCASQYKI